MMRDKSFQTKHIKTWQVLMAVELAKLSPLTNVAESLQVMTEAPDKVVYCALYREDSKGLLDWGVSVSYAWLTEAGEREIVKWLKDQGGEADNIEEFRIALRMSIDQQIRAIRKQS